MGREAASALVGKMRTRAQELAARMMEGAEDFDPRRYFLGRLGFLAQRGFKRCELDRSQEEAGFDELWRYEDMPFILYMSLRVAAVLQVAVKFHGDNGEVLVNNWTYREEEVEAALAQVDRLVPLIHDCHDVHGEFNIFHQIAMMQKAPMLGEEAEDFNALGCLDYESRLAGMGFDKDSDDTYSKKFLISQEGRPLVWVTVGLVYEQDAVHAYVLVSECRRSMVAKTKRLAPDDVYAYVDEIAGTVERLRESGAGSAQAACLELAALNENGQKFDARQYFMSPNEDVKLLLHLGYLKTDETQDSYTKLLFERRGDSHFLNVCGIDDTSVVFAAVSYVCHIPLIGWTFPWEGSINKDDLRTKLPLLESGIRSADEQDISDVELKRALDALVK
jgi:hypothetical protein